MDLNNLTDEQLVAMNQKLGAQQDEIRRERIVLAAELRKREAARVLAAAGVKVDAIVQGQVLETKAEGV